MSSWPVWNPSNVPYLAELGVLDVYLKLNFISIYRDHMRVGVQSRGCLLRSCWWFKRWKLEHGLWIVSRSISVILNQVTLAFLLYTSCTLWKLLQKCFLKLSCIARPFLNTWHWNPGWLTSNTRAEKMSWAKQLHVEEFCSICCSSTPASDLDFIVEKKK